VHRLALPRCGAAVLYYALGAGSASVAAAREAGETDDNATDASLAGGRAAARAEIPPMGPYVRLLGGAGLGRGIRFNNPYRLATVLGETPESLSLTATYLDVFVAATMGNPDGLQHGVAVHGAAALDGIAQEVVTPSYLALWHPSERVGLTGRMGLPVVITPDTNIGYEVGLGALLWLTASLGLAAELVGSVYQGAGTPTQGSTLIPIVSLQVGVAYQFEVLP
jgi:hypothetical protein